AGPAGRHRSHVHSVSIDTLRFAESVGSLPEQFAVGHKAAASVELGPLDGSRVSAIVVCGMGGSGISGDVLHAVAGGVLPVPMVVAKGYELPGFVGPSTLVFGVSYSG